MRNLVALILFLISFSTQVAFAKSKACYTASSPTQCRLWSCCKVYKTVYAKRKSKAKSWGCRVEITGPKCRDRVKSKALPANPGKAADCEVDKKKEEVSHAESVQEILNKADAVQDEEKNQSTEDESFMHADEDTLEELKTLEVVDEKSTTTTSLNSKITKLEIKVVEQEKQQNLKSRPLTSERPKVTNSRDFKKQFKNEQKRLKEEATVLEVEDKKLKTEIEQTDELVELKIKERLIQKMKGVPESELKGYIAPLTDVLKDKTNITFIIDTSGSMSGRPLELLINQLKNVIKGATEGKRLNFMSQTERGVYKYAETTVPLGKDRGEMSQWLKKLDQANGVSAVGNAIKLAMNDPHTDAIVLISDSALYDGDELDALIRNSGASLSKPIHSIEIGYFSDADPRISAVKSLIKEQQGLEADLDFMLAMGLDPDVVTSKAMIEEQILKRTALVRRRSIQNDKLSDENDAKITRLKSLLKYENKTLSSLIGDISDKIDAKQLLVQNIYAKDSGESYLSKLSRATKGRFTVVDNNSPNFYKSSVEAEFSLEILRSPGELERIQKRIKELEDKRAKK